VKNSHNFGGKNVQFFLRGQLFRVCQIVNIVAKTKKIQHTVAEQWPAMHGVQIFSPDSSIPIQNLLSSGAFGGAKFLE
jgi:hypothetical protein